MNRTFEVSRNPIVMDPLPLFQYLAISTLLGLLVGLQRERADSKVAGVRTFPLITALGTLCAVFARDLNSPWMLPVGFAGIVVLAFVGNMPKLKQAEGDFGLTTEVAMLVMYVVGAFVVFGPWSVAVVVASGVAVLLYLKPVLHGFVTRLGDQDFRAIMQFVLITFIILPVLPNESYNPLVILEPLFPDAAFMEVAVLNPFEVWLLAVLVVGISLGGYIIYKVFGPRAGSVLGGILGGTISSTATTVSYSRRTAGSPESAALAAIVIIVSTTVSYVRVLLEVAIAGPRLLPAAAPPILVVLAVSVGLSFVAWLLQGRRETHMPEQENPTELKTAFIFASLYAIILMAVAVGRLYLPDEGLYVIAGLSGMTDMDAITLSTSRLVQRDQLEAEVGWRLIVVAMMSNLFFKGCIVAAIGDRSLRRRVWALFGISLAAGVAVLLLWP
jgi:uncharacterized membrane protein (DUF4010 family)